MNETLRIDLNHEIVNVGEDQEEIFLEPILNEFTDQYFREMRFCLPARVVGVQNLDQLRIDVQPLINIRYEDNVVSKMPIIENVPMFCLGTDETAVLFPVKQGQTVLLLFSQLSLDEFKAGAITQYTSRDNRKMDLQDAIAFPSIFPFNRSPNRAERHFTDHSLDDLSLVHNLGTSRENKVVLEKSGGVKIISASAVDVEAPQANFAKVVNVKEKLNAGVDITIAGRSVLNFMNTHTHNYTDDGNMMVTAPANPTT